MAILGETFPWKIIAKKIDCKHFISAYPILLIDLFDMNAVGSIPKCLCVDTCKASVRYYLPIEREELSVNSIDFCKYLMC